RFAPGEFLDLNDDQKLSRPAFEPFPAGIVIAPENIVHGDASDSFYEWNTVCPPVRTLPTRQKFSSLAGMHAVLLANGPAGRAQVASTNPYATVADPIKAADPGTVTVRSTRDLAPLAGVPASAMTTTRAAEIVAGQPAGQAQWVGAGVGA